MTEMEHTVWQRVLGQQEQPNQDIKQLAAQSQQAAAEYRHLLRSRVESHRELGKKLLSGEQETLYALKGLYYLQTGYELKLPGANVLGVDAKRLVRRYHSTRRNLTEYMARSAEPEWGCVYLALAHRQEQQCDLLAQLLGHMK